MNRVILIGNLGMDPVLRQSKTNDTFVVFTLATEEHWVNAQGEKQKRIDWHKVVVFRPKLIEWCCLYLKKGAKVVVEGTLCNHKYKNPEGQEFNASEIIIGRGYGHITCLSPLPRKKEEGSEAEDVQDRIAGQKASS